MAGDGVLENGVEETAHVSGVFSGTDQFAHQDIGTHLNLGGGYAVEFVVLLLLGAATGSFADGLVHGGRYRIGVHDHQAVDVAGGAAGGLGEGAAAAEEALLVGVQDGHQGYGGDVQAFTEEVHANEHVKQAVLEVFDNLHTLSGVHV